MQTKNLILQNLKNLKVPGSPPLPPAPPKSIFKTHLKSDSEKRTPKSCKSDAKGSPIVSQWEPKFLNFCKKLSKTHTQKKMPKVVQMSALRTFSNLKNYAPAWAGA